MRQIPITAFLRLAARNRKVMANACLAFPTAVSYEERLLFGTILRPSRRQFGEKFRLKVQILQGS